MVLKIFENFLDSVLDQGISGEENSNVRLFHGTNIYKVCNFDLSDDQNIQ